MVRRDGLWRRCRRRAPRHRRPVCDDRAGPEFSQVRPTALGELPVTVDVQRHRRVPGLIRRVRAHRLAAARVPRRGGGRIADIFMQRAECPGDGSEGIRRVLSGWFRAIVSLDGWLCLGHEDEDRWLCIAALVDPMPTVLKEVSRAAWHARWRSSAGLHMMRSWLCAQSPASLLPPGGCLHHDSHRDTSSMLGAGSLLAGGSRGGGHRRTLHTTRLRPSFFA